MSQSQADDDRTGIRVSHDKTLVQRERINVSSQRGSGTNDRDSVDKTIEREAEIEVGEDVELPDLIGVSEMNDAVQEVAATMNEIRQNQPDN